MDAMVSGIWHNGAVWAVPGILCLPLHNAHPGGSQKRITTGCADGFFRTCWVGPVMPEFDCALKDGTINITAAVREVEAEEHARPSQDVPVQRRLLCSRGQEA